ncbi:hypothetical protein KKF82_05385 [Patescibacteria group bacterium]|nr:hypothetical protein [Patescibacteria group bacterium]
MPNIDFYDLPDDEELSRISEILFWYMTFLKKHAPDATEAISVIKEAFTEFPESRDNIMSTVARLQKEGK